MIPALAGRKKAAAAIIAYGKNSPPQGMSDGGEVDPLGVISRELIAAVKNNDAGGVASALKAAFNCMGAYESEEG